MRVRCVKARPSDEEMAPLGLPQHVGQDFHLTQGKEYVVLGVQLAIGSNIHGTGVWLHLVSDYGSLSWAPLLLFEVIDGRGSRHWVLRAHSPKLVTLWPQAFYRDGFHEDLADGVAQVVNEFGEVRAALEAEAGT